MNNKNPHSTFDSLRAAITIVMTHMDEDYLILTYEYFRQRIESVIAAEGDFIEELYRKRVTYFAVNNSLQ